jgi:hypothetical protein
LTGIRGRKTASACDKSAKDTSMCNAVHFMFIAKNPSQKVHHVCAIVLPAFVVAHCRQLVSPLVVVVGF